MILERLNEFWKAQPDTMRPGYQKALLTKWVKLDAQGKSLGPAITLTGDGTKVRDGKRIEVPREQPQRTSGVRARLVHDNGRYVLGLLGEGDKPARVAEAHRAYVELLRQAAEATDDAAFGAVLRWIEGGAAETAEAQGITAGDDLWITVEGIDPTEGESAAAFWNLPSDKGAITMRCLVTGELAEVGKAMPYPIKRIPGGQMSGNMLVSVNFAAAQSYGLEGNLNSPISKVAAEAICNALNRLLASAEHSYRVGETVYVYWQRSDLERDALRALKEPTPEEVDPLVARFQRRKRPAKADPARVGRLVAAPKEGTTPAGADPIDFVMISLTANASRIAVRDYHELTLPKLEERIGEWFARLELLGADRKPLRRPKLVPLAYCGYRDKKDMPKHVPVQLMDCALRGTPLPKSLLATAVRRNVVEQGPYTTYNGVRSLSANRLALIKACLTPQDFDPENDPLASLDLENKQPAYNCGRLLALVDSIQRAYFKVEGREINRTVVDRHYGGASTAPGVNFGPLLADATQAHLGKLQRDKRTQGTYLALERELREILENLPEFPQTLNHIEQGLFALGFYHQRTYSIQRAMERKAAGQADAATDAIIEPTIDPTEDEGASE